jgi:hypothetical protein
MLFAQIYMSFACLGITSPKRFDRGTGFFRNFFDGLESGEGALSNDFLHDYWSNEHSQGMAVLLLILH